MISFSDLVLGPRIGRGLLCDVHEYRHASERFAVKTLRWEHRTDLNVQRFLEEAERLHSLQHEGLIPGHGFGIAAEIPFCIMEFGTGDLEQRARIRLTSHEVIELLSDVAPAIDFLHQGGRVHGDIKPDNIFVVETPLRQRAKLGDLGLLRSFDYLLHPPVFARYAAVELLEGRHIARAIRYRSDIYSLAVTAAHLFSGRLPPLHRRSSNLWAGSLPESLASVLLAGMHEDPAERPSSATELTRQIREALPDNPFSLPVFRTPEEQI
jgi:eukaryotic-like serine/threonine-protein kinase